MRTAVEVHVHFCWCSVFFCTSSEISSNFMTLIVDILRPTNNMNSASCIFRGRKAGSLPDPLMLQAVGVVMTAAECY